VIWGELPGDPRATVWGTKLNTCAFDLAGEDAGALGARPIPTPVRARDAVEQRKSAGVSGRGALSGRGHLFTNTREVAIGGQLINSLTTLMTASAKASRVLGPVVSNARL